MKVAETLEHNLRTDLASPWLELRAAEIILQDVTAEFDGEDPLSVTLRRALDHTNAELLSLYQVFGQKDQAAPPEPNVAEIEFVREYFDSGVRLMARL